MAEAGVPYPLVIGGYKAMRRFLLDELDRLVLSANFVLVAGKTGTGKTRVIQAVPGSLDLEALAGHRGSSFGRLLDEQPSQIDFENAVATALLRLEATGASAVLLEDEGRLIGRTSLPDALREKMQGAPLLLVEETLASRVQVILEDYVLDLGARYRERYGAEGKERHLQHLVDSLLRIKKRLGGELHSEVGGILQKAFAAGSPEASDALHRQWIERLLVKYYDPMYEYQMTRREGAIIARGARSDIITRAGEILRQ
jgi:tRNA 2-selenouridine synthase